MKLRSRVKVEKPKEERTAIRLEEHSVTKTKPVKSAKQRKARQNKISSSQGDGKRSLLDSQPPKLSKKRSSARNKKTKKIETEEVKLPERIIKHDTDAAKLTQWTEVTILELSEILKEERKHHKDVEEEEICPICRCELYDDIFKLSEKEIKEMHDKQLQDPGSINVVKFKNCLNHFYHKE